MISWLEIFWKRMLLDISNLYLVSRTFGMLINKRWGLRVLQKFEGTIFFDPQKMYQRIPTSSPPHWHHLHIEHSTKAKAADREKDQTTVGTLTVKSTTGRGNMSARNGGGNLATLYREIKLAKWVLMKWPKSKPQYKVARGYLI